MVTALPVVQFGIASDLRFLGLHGVAEFFGILSLIYFVLNYEIRLGGGGGALPDMLGDPGETSFGFGYSLIGDWSGATHALA